MEMQAVHAVGAAATLLDPPRCRSDDASSAATAAGTGGSEAHSAAAADVEDEAPLKVGDVVFYNHRELGHILVEISKVDHEGSFDGGATYVISSPDLAGGVVETVRSRLHTKLPDWRPGERR